MSNPWLSIPLSDYEGHMTAETVGQLAVLSRLFAEALETVRPESVAVLGVAGGNGLEHVDASVTRRVVGVDIHAGYLEEARRRFPLLEAHRCDLAAETLGIAPVRLVHAALIFEHAGTDACLRNAMSLVAGGGWMSVVLQLPSESTAGVAETPFPSIQRLRDHFQFVDPEALAQSLGARGFVLARESRTAVPGGKSFWMGIFRQNE